MDFCIYCTPVFLSLAVQNLVLGICNSPLSDHLSEPLSSLINGAWAQAKKIIWENISDKLLPSAQEDNLREDETHSIFKILLLFLPIKVFFDLHGIGLVWSTLLRWPQEIGVNIQWVMLYECYNVVFASFVLIAMRPKKIRKKISSKSWLAYLDSYPTKLFLIMFCF